MGGESKASSRRVIAKERRTQALFLRKSGATYDEIAKAIGYASEAGARKAVRMAMEKLDSAAKEEAEEVRKLEALRLDELLKGLWKLAKSGQTEHVDRVLKIMERRSRLFGLDAPKRTEISGKLDTSPERGLDPSIMTDEELTEYERITGEYTRFVEAFEARIAEETEA